MTRMIVAMALALGLLLVGFSPSAPADDPKALTAPKKTDRPQVWVSLVFPKKTFEEKTGRERLENIMLDLIRRGERSSQGVGVQPTTLSDQPVVSANVRYDPAMPSKDVAAVVEVLLDLGVKRISLDTKAGK